MGVRITKTGKTILTGKDYSRLREEVFESQRDEDGISRCCDCGDQIFLETMHLHHLSGRAGGKRNDVKEEVVGACPRCHGRRHGQVIPR